MAAPMRELGSGLRSTLCKSKVTNAFSEKRYISYHKNSNGVWLPGTHEGKNRYEEFNSFLHKKWSAIDKSVKLMIIEFFTKSALYIFTGGGGAYLMKTTLDRLGKLEDHVLQSDKELKEFKNQVQIESKNSEKQFRKYSQESHASHLKVNSDLNELKLLKDLWLSSLYTRSSEDVLSPSAKEINVKESDELKLLFDLIDKDHDGYISLPEIHELAASLKEKLSGEEVDKLIHEAGMMPKGVLTCQSFRI